MEIVRFLSDYTSEETPNVLDIVLDEQGDIHISCFISSENEEEHNRSIRIASSGTRYSSNIRKAWIELFRLYQAEIENTNQQAIKDLNT